MHIRKIYVRTNKDPSDVLHGGVRKKDLQINLADIYFITEEFTINSILFGQRYF